MLLILWQVLPSLLITFMFKAENLPKLYAKMGLKWHDHLNDFRLSQVLTDSVGDHALDSSTLKMEKSVFPVPVTLSPDSRSCNTYATRELPRLSTAPQQQAGSS